uniref:Uncharacterized protein n=1 Tax=Ditylenchus dipsaci TaxID=166011 RepID=A0A915CUF7_9BILA
MAVKSNISTVFAVVVIFLTFCIGVDGQEVEDSADLGVENHDPPALECFYCQHSRRERDVVDNLDQHPECLSWAKMANDSSLKRTCTAREPYCLHYQVYSSHRCKLPMSSRRFHV